MNFKEICQKAVSEAGIAGGGPATVVNQTNELGKIVSRASDSWVEIQGEKPWNFLRDLKTFVLIPGLQDYRITESSNPGDLNWQNLREVDAKDKIILTRAVDGAKSEIKLLSWSQWRTQYALQITFAAGPPSAAVLTPDGKVRFNALPDAADTIEIPFWKTSTILAADADTPAILADFHWVIVWRTVQRFAASKGALTLAGIAAAKEYPIYARMMMKYLPPVEVGPNPIT